MLSPCLFSEPSLQVPPRLVPECKEGFLVARPKGPFLPHNNKPQSIFSDVKCTVSALQKPGLMRGWKERDGVDLPCAKLGLEGTPE